MRLTRTKERLNIFGRIIGGSDVTVMKNYMEYRFMVMAWWNSIYE